MVIRIKFRKRIQKNWRKQENYFPLKMILKNSGKLREICHFLKCYFKNNYGKTQRVIKKIPTEKFWRFQEISVFHNILNLFEKFHLRFSLFLF